jgi:hypothetical protein
MYNGPNIVTDGLVLDLDAANVKSYPGSGTSIYDLSGNGNNGTLTNGPTFDSGNLGNIDFDGTNDEIRTFDYDLDFGTNSFTLSAWIKTSNNTQRGKIINKGLSASFPNGSKGYSIRFFSIASFSVGDGTNFTSVDVSNVNDVPNNEWVCFVGVCDRSNLTQYIYINGGVNNTTAVNYTSTTNDDAELTIGSLNRGSYGGNSEFFDGQISNVQIYNRALTAEEVFQNYNATKSRFGL